MVNKERIKLWIDALRSGRYKQTFGELHDPETGAFCALGVACEVYREAHPETCTWDGFYIAVEDHRDAAELAPEIRDWFGLSSTDPELENGLTVAELNDNSDTFEEIAEALEEEYLAE